MILLSSIGKNSFMLFDSLICLVFYWQLSNGRRMCRHAWASADYSWPASKSCHVHAGVRRAGSCLLQALAGLSLGSERSSVAVSLDHWKRRFYSQSIWNRNSFNMIIFVFKNSFKQTFALIAASNDHLFLKRLNSHGLLLLFVHRDPCGKQLWFCELLGFAQWKQAVQESADSKQHLQHFIWCRREGWCRTMQFWFQSSPTWRQLACPLAEEHKCFLESMSVPNMVTPQPEGRMWGVGDTSLGCLRCSVAWDSLLGTDLAAALDKGVRLLVQLGGSEPRGWWWPCAGPRCGTVGSGAAEGEVTHPQRPPVLSAGAPGLTGSRRGAGRRVQLRARRSWAGDCQASLRTLAGGSSRISALGSAGWGGEVTLEAARYDPGLVYIRCWDRNSLLTTWWVKFFSATAPCLLQFFLKLL